MGFCFSSCVTNKLKNIQEGRVESSFLILDAPVSVSTNSVFEDCPFFYEDEKWHMDLAQTTGKLLLDCNRFLDQYPNYKMDQKELLRNWNEKDIKDFLHCHSKLRKKTCISANWKFLIRKGVPMRYMRPVVLHLFQRDKDDNEAEYKTVLDVVYAGRIPTGIKNCPTFSEEENLEKTLKLHFLTNEGIYTLKRLLWVVKETCYFLTYNPMIVQILSLFLIFLTEAEAYFCVKAMIDASKSILDKGRQSLEGVRAMRWYITLESDDFTKLCASFFDTVQEKSFYFNEILAFFNKHNFPYNSMFQEWIKGLFVEVFPLSNEILNEKLKDGIASEIKNKSRKFNLIEAHKLLKMMFALGLTNMKSTFAQISFAKLSFSSGESFIYQKPKAIYRPKVDQPSNIITDEQWETIWEQLPNANKLSDAELVFSTYFDGYSLLSLYLKCRKYRDESFVFLIKNNLGYVFGAFVDAVPKIDGKCLYQGSRESYVFTLVPHEKKYMNTLMNTDHMRCEESYFSFGSEGDGVAIFIDKDLNQGHSYRSETYNNQSFGDPIDGTFQLCALELYALI